MLNEFKDAFRKPNNAHAQLIIINVVVFLVLGVLYVFLTASGNGLVFKAIHNQLSIPATLQDFVLKPWTLITYAFVHDLSGIFHILFNMLAFYWFGKLFVEYLGSDKLIAVYVLGALAGAFFYLLVYNLVPFYKGQIPADGMVANSALV